MARYKNILDGSSGRVGNIITYQMYGKSYMRSCPEKYNDRKSDKQLAQRQKMQLINGFISPFKDLFRLTFAHKAVGRSAYQAAKSYNLLNGIKGNYPNQEIDYHHSRISIGSVPLPDEIAFKMTAEGLYFTWKNNNCGYSNDILVVVAGLREQSNVYMKQTGVERQDKAFLWKIDLDPSVTWDIWVIFRDYQERGYSDSHYLGMVNV